MKKNRQKKEKNPLVARLKLWWGRLPTDVPIKDYFLIFICVVLILSLVFFWEDKFATFLITVIGGGLFILQIFNSNRRATAAEKTADSMRETVELNEKGHIAERFKNAIEHLGSESASIRLGGIYALHNLAQDVEKYRKQVFEILCAHIRETTTRNGYEPRVGQYGDKHPSIEIQSILNLLFVSKQDREIYLNLRANLESANLEGVDLDEAILKNANMVNVILIGARLWSTDLQNAILIGVELNNATLFDVDLQECNFYQADLERANLETVKNLKADQLFGAYHLYSAKLPDGMKDEIRSQMPELLVNLEDGKGI